MSGSKSSTTLANSVAIPRVVVVAGSIAIAVLVLLVAFLVVRAALVPTDAMVVASNPRWGACTQDQAGQGYQCAAVATVTNQGGSRGSQVYRYLAFYLPDGSGCDVDVPQLDPAASRPLSCEVRFSSNYPSGSGPGLAPTDPPKAIVRQP
jgi:hypothetical protein